MVIEKEINTIEGFIIILGSSNDENGTLSHFAEERLDKGIEEYKKHKNHKIILTGGYGNHFNRTAHSHAYHAKQFLLKNNIADDEILGLVESRFTLEDALLTKKTIDKLFVRSLIIVSSDFHINRVQYIFDRIFLDYHLEYSSAKTDVTQSEMEALHLEELEKLCLLRKKYEGQGNRFEIA